MKLKRLLKGFLFLIVSTALGVGIVLVLLSQHNYQLVYYGPRNEISIRTDSEPSDPYPMLPDNDIRNIILFISDGMGLSQLAATRIHYLGPDGRLHIERMPVTGLVTPHAIDNIITDSAASATSLATGVKTKKKGISVDPDGKKLTTSLEAARDAGLATGLVTSTDITDATPAAFASHVLHRNNDEAQIALQLIESKVNVLIGQGPFFYHQDDSRSKRQDDIDPIQIAKEAGYVFVDTKEKLRTASGNYLLGLFENLEPDPLAQEFHRGQDTPTMAELTQKSIELLNRNQKGFFLMVEEEATDSGSHINREDYVIHHLKEFDNAVQVGLEFALKDQHTLVLVMADHETGGFNIVKGAYEDGHLEFIWNSNGHTGQPVSMFAFGPHAIRFTGMKDNTEIPKIFAELLRLENFPR